MVEPFKGTCGSCTFYLGLDSGDCCANPPVIVNALVAWMMDGANDSFIDEAIASASSRPRVYSTNPCCRFYVEKPK